MTNPINATLLNNLKIVLLTCKQGGIGTMTLRASTVEAMIHELEYLRSKSTLDDLLIDMAHKALMSKTFVPEEGPKPEAKPESNGPVTATLDDLLTDMAHKVLMNKTFVPEGGHKPEAKPECSDSVTAALKDLLSIIDKLGMPVEILAGSEACDESQAYQVGGYASEIKKHEHIYRGYDWTFINTPAPFNQKAYFTAKSKQHAEKCKAEMEAANIFCICSWGG